MAYTSTDWSINRSSGNIRYIGDDHGGGSPSYATVIEAHRAWQDFADNAVSSLDDELDITDENPSNRSTDNIIQLLGLYNIDDASAEHLYDGSIIQGTGGTEVIYDGIVNFGNSDVQIQIMQNGAVLADDWWNFGGGGLNADSAQGISHRFMLKVRNAGADVDGRRLIGTSRTLGNTYGEFSINGTSRGNNVLALSDGNDLNNNTIEGTLAAIADVFIDRTVTTTTVSGVNSTGQAVLNVVDGTQFSAGDFIMIAGDDGEYQVLSIATNALTLNRNLDTATAGAEATYDLNIGFTQLDVDNNASTENYYAQWDRGAGSINTFYERLKWLSRDGSLQYIYGLPGELFRGITHEITVDTLTGTFAAVEGVSWSTGSGQMFAINDTDTKIWIQLLTGVPPTDGVTITGAISGATVDVNVTVTDRSATIRTPFVGQSTGSALIGSYGLSLQTADLSNADTVFDLGNASVTPPNNVSNTVAGLVSGEDYVLVSPWDGTTTDNEGNPAIDENQLSLSGTLSTVNVASVVVSTGIPSDTPSVGTIRVTNNNGFDRRLEYSAWTGSTFTISSTDGQEDFDVVNATAGNNVYITYLDKLADATSASFTGVYNSARNLVVVVRDGGGTPIKQFISAWTFAGSNSTITAIRTSDE